jgi:hypothetical protein
VDEAELQRKQGIMSFIAGNVCRVFLCTQLECFAVFILSLDMDPYMLICETAINEVVRAWLWFLMGFFFFPIMCSQNSNYMVQRGLSGICSS